MNEKTFRCRADGCGQEFASASAVRSHRRTAHPAPAPDLGPALSPEAQAVKRLKAFGIELLRGAETLSDHFSDRDGEIAIGLKIFELCEVTE